MTSPTFVRPLGSGGASVTGHRRPTNEDAWLTGPAWWVVADGMGGHAAGEQASRMVVEAFAATPPVTGEGGLIAAVEAVNRVVRAAATGEASGMGATIVGLHPVGDRVAVFHVGDARAYRLLDGSFERLTTDHTYVQELIDAGFLDPSQAGEHPLRNVVTRAVGVDADVEPTVGWWPAAGRFLLCSDGVSGSVDAVTIERVLATVPDPQDAAEHLVALVLAGPARDNATAVVVDVPPGGSRRAGCETMGDR